MVPNNPNVYGGFADWHGLGAVLEALRPLFAEREVYINDDSVNGEVLLIRNDSVFFHTMHMKEEECYMFDGGVDGTLEQVIGVPHEKWTGS
jgi:hypothetical protein